MLFRSNGEGDYSDVTKEAGLKQVGGNSYSAVFLDFNGDKKPDLFVSEWAPYELAIECLIRPEVTLSEGTPRLFRKVNGRFEEVTAEVGLNHAYGTMRAVAADLDHDGWTDITLENGGPEEWRLEPSVLLHNEKGKRFIEWTHPLSRDYR